MPTPHPPLLPHSCSDSQGFCCTCTLVGSTWDYTYRGGLVCTDSSGTAYADLPASASCLRFNDNWWYVVRDRAELGGGGVKGGSLPGWGAALPATGAAGDLAGPGWCLLAAGSMRVGWPRGKGLLPV